MTKRALQHVGLGAVLAPVVVVGLWSVWIVQAFELPKPFGANLLRAAEMAFTAPNLRTVTFGSLALGIGIAGLLATLVYRFSNPRQMSHTFVRGSEFIEQGELARYTRRSRAHGREPHREYITLARVPIPSHIERLHFLVGGTTQSGKSVTITEMLAGALARGDRAVVADPNGGYYARFGRKGDVILNPGSLIQD